MFLSEPICILKAGNTVDGRTIDQSVIDDIAETYNPSTYTARCNEDHWQWGKKLGSVVSVEKRGDELWATIKPNSHLLSRLEDGQYLHTSVEFHKNFAGTGRAYLTGLAFTDNPASLGTTQVHLSANDNENIIYASADQPISLGLGDEFTKDDVTFFKKFMNFIKGSHHASDVQLSQQSTNHNELSDLEMDELKALLKAQAESITALTAQVADAIKPTAATEPEPEEDKKVGELELKVEALTAELNEIKEILSKTPLEPEKFRKLAGQDPEDEFYL